MANSIAYYEEVRFDLRDESKVDCYIYIRNDGEYFYGLQGWHFKSFQAPMSVGDILNGWAEGTIESPITWELKDPPEEKKVTPTLGKTANQMAQAYPRSVYIWCNDSLAYPTQLAAKIGRSDLIIVGISKLDEPLYWHGRILAGLVVDHGAVVHITPQRADTLERIKPFIRRTN